jgi:hypothetical protein
VGGRLVPAVTELGGAVAEIDLDDADGFQRRQGFGGGKKRWSLHDLWRTARSLVSKAGVPSDHAERCLWSRPAWSPRYLRPL